MGVFRVGKQASSGVRWLHFRSCHTCAAYEGHKAQKGNCVAFTGHPRSFVS